MKNKGYLFLSLSLLTVLVAILLFISKTAISRFMQNQKDSYVINIYPQEKKYVSVTEIKSILEKYDRRDTTGIVRVRKMESALQSHPFIDNAEVYLDGQGNIHADIYQFKPLALVQLSFTKKVLDSAGYLKPLPPGKWHLPVIEGYVTQENIRKIFPVFKQMKEDAFFRSKLKRLKITGQTGMILRLYGFSPEIILGDTTAYRVKLTKLKEIFAVFNEKKLQNRYKEINLQYRGQVIAKK